jgi:hypothetical protein
MQSMTLNRKPVIIAAFVLAVAFSSCATVNTSYRIIEATEDTRVKIVSYARQYAARDSEYLLGGRPYLEKNGTLVIDCSGLIVRVCQYAVNGTKYSLLFDDATVRTLYSNFTSTINEPSPGDFIFMGEGNPPTHMGIFIRRDGNDIYFIDATLKEADEINGYDAVDGVTLRHYPKDDPRFLSFARLLVKQGGLQ